MSRPLIPVFQAKWKKKMRNEVLPKKKKKEIALRRLDCSTSFSQSKIGADFMRQTNIAQAREKKNLTIIKVSEPIYFSANICPAINELQLILPPEARIALFKKEY